MDEQMSEKLKEKFQEIIWVARQLFDRGKTSGSSANLSFRHKDKVYVSGTNTCFGDLTIESFSVLSLQGEHIKGIKPSKEYPLHLALYNSRQDNQAVIHTHSRYSTLWSCLEFDNKEDVIPSYTPYLDMKLGPIKLVDYYAPGSEELFDAFEQRVDEQRGYLLQNHGPIVADETILKAFYSLEELEESAAIAWEFKNSDLKANKLRG
jgi:ribulose-5-phosphate 4-epimerase/fuculose-1-phosphate aldolase